MVFDKKGVNPDGKSESAEEHDDDQIISKTQLKNEAKALQDFAKQLVELSAAKVKLLPLNEVTIFAINDYHKQSGNIAKKRHVSYIGKCLRNDNAEQAKQVLQDDYFGQLRGKPSEKSKQNQMQLIEQLVSEGDSRIQKLVEEYPSLDRQSLRQLVRNVSNSKTPQKTTQATTKLNNFLIENRVKAN